MAIYTRISDDRQKTGAGVARQRDDCQQLAQAQHLNVIAVFEDNDRSAYKRNAKRPQWESLKQLIAAGSLDGIVVWHTDRLYRHPSQLEDIIELVERSNLTIYTVTAGEIDLNTPTGRMVARLLGSVARNEVEHKAERQQRAHLELAKQGRWHGGQIPTGFQRSSSGEKGVLEHHPVQAPALRAAAQRIILGQSLASTARWFTEETGKYVDSGRLKAVLTGPKVAGLRMHIPQEARDKWAGHRARRMVSGDVPPNMATYKAQWDAILDDDTWLKVRAILLDPARRTNIGRPAKALLGGLVYCAGCTCVMSRSSTTYACHAGTAEWACGKVSISTRALETLIKDAISARASKTEQFDVPLTPIEEEAPLPLDSIENRRLEVLDLHSDGIITKAEMIRQLDRLDSRIAELEETRAQQLRDRIRQQQIVDGLKFWADMRATLDSAATPDEQLVASARSLIGRVIERINIAPAPRGNKSGARFNPERVAVIWREARPRPAASHQKHQKAN